MIPTDAQSIAFNLAAASVDGGDAVGVQLTLTSITGDREDVLEAVEIGLHAMANEITARHPGHVIELGSQWTVSGYENIEHP